MPTATRRIGAPATLSMPIGGERPADSYLRIDKLLEAARASGAQAMHPGYGFLAENAAFAQAVLDAGLVWVGPPPAAMRAMGDKARARQAHGCARRAGAARLRRRGAGPRRRCAREAQRIGLPLMVKAAAGGGGRGMRLVDASPSFRRGAGIGALARRRPPSATAACCSNARCSAPRHVEIQVFADAHGNVLHLGERDCSVQRRHQKIIEEAPSPAVDRRRCAGAWARPRWRWRARSATSARARSSSCSTHERRISGSWR